MSSMLNKFQELLAVSKIMTELQRELGIEDRVLAEFILNLAIHSTTVDEFSRKLDEKQADLNQDLINTIFAVTTRILPRKNTSQRSQKKGFERLESGEQDDDRSEISLPERKSIRDLSDGANSDV